MHWHAVFYSCVTFAVLLFFVLYRWQVYTEISEVRHGKTHTRTGRLYISVSAVVVESSNEISTGGDGVAKVAENE